MEALNKDILSLIAKFSSYLPLRQVSKAMYRNFTLTPEQVDSLALYYLLTQRKVKKRPIPKALLTYTMNEGSPEEVKHCPFDPGLNIPMKTKEDISPFGEKRVVQYFTKDYVFYIRMHMPFPLDGQYYCQAYDIAKDKHDTTLIPGRLLPSNNHMAVVKHTTREDLKLTLYKPRLPKIKVYIPPRGRMCSTKIAGEYAGFYFYNGSMIRIRDGWVVQDACFSRLIFKEPGVIQARYKKHWVEMDFRPLIFRF